jgi:MoxR-like ATPase
METIAAKDFRDADKMEELYQFYKAGTIPAWKGGTEPAKATLTNLEEHFNLAPGNGCSAWRVFYRHVVLAGKPDPLPRSLRDGKDPEFKALLKDKPKPVEEPKQEVQEVVVEIKANHKLFPDLLRTARARVHALLVGPAGSGKTSAASQAAKELGLPFYSISVGGQTTQSQIIGYMDATGKYIRTVFREAYEKGGLFLLDEVDAGNANVLTVLNAALANGVYAFPDGMVQRNADFICIAAANTWGAGADRQYVGRNQLDAATLDRFMGKLFWDYDEDMETLWSGNAAWAKRVQRIRAATASLKARVLVTPRASIEGAKLLNAGFSRSQVEDMTVFNATDAETKRKILAAV